MNATRHPTTPVRPSRPRGRLLSALCGLALALGCLLAVPATAEAREVVHVVRKGQWLDLIAKRYHTTADAILKRNGMKGNDLKPGMKLIIVETDEHRKWREHVEKQTGKSVPERVHRTEPPKPAPKKAAPKKAAPKPAPKKTTPPKPPETHPAKTADEPPPREIKSAKQRVAPRRAPAPAVADPEKVTAPETGSAPETAAANAPSATSADQAYAKAPKRPGYVTLIRYGEKFRGQLVAPDGKLIAKASKRVDRLLRSLRTGKQTEIDRRLLALLTKVSDHFGGRTIVIVSGFRPYSPKQYTRNSRHNHGEAVDFKVTGVPTDVVFQLCRQFDDVGCGFYPNSGFVHMDVRGRKTQWTDYSKPGQAPKYAHRDKHAAARDVTLPTAEATSTASAAKASQADEPEAEPEGEDTARSGSSAKRHVAGKK